MTVIGVTGTQEERMVLLDGAAGTTLWEIAEENGVKKDVVWKYNIERPELVTCLHKRMIDAGAEIIITNTFAANPPMVRRQSEYEPQDVIARGVELAKSAASGSDVQVALSLGPLPQLMEPYGDLGEEETEELYREMLTSGVKAGADMIFLATFTDLRMIRVAIRAARKYDVPLYCMMTFEKSGKTMMGQSVREICEALAGEGLAGIGMNCSLGPQEALPVIREFAEYTALPLIVKPNAGMPGRIESPERFAEILRPVFPLVGFLGGCCNCDERYVAALKRAIG